MHLKKDRKETRRKNSYWKNRKMLPVFFFILQRLNDVFAYVEKNFPCVFLCLFAMCVHVVSNTKVVYIKLMGHSKLLLLFFPYTIFSYFWRAFSMLYFFVFFSFFSLQIYIFIRLSPYCICILLRIYCIWFHLVHMLSSIAFVCYFIYRILPRFLFLMIFK